MPSIYVCSLSRLHDTVATTNASHIATLINASTPVERPAHIAMDQHLFLGMSDIVAPLDGHILPGNGHVEQLLTFIDGWGRNRRRPIVVHCWAGISRSTAAAFITACRLAPEVPETEWARQIREKSPTATPNIKLVALADELLSREGRMVAAIESIGRGVEAFDGVPFRIDLPRNGAG
jgi:predicted protein tyrosine phosphatase